MRIPTLILATFLVLTCVAGAASAHRTAYSPDGKIKIVWGFLNEPAVTMTKNGLDLRIQDNATGHSIPDLQSALRVELRYGEEKLHVEDLAGQFGKPGYYTGLVTPSRPGVYTLHVSGTVNGTALDMEIPGAHPVEPIEDTYFPPVSGEPGSGALEARIAQLEAKVQQLEAKASTQASTPTPLTSGGKSSPVPGLGLVAVLAVLAAVVLARRR